MIPMVFKVPLVQKKCPGRQRGAVTIFVSMLLLFMITVLVLTAFTLSTTNFRAVNNVQVRDEAIAAANIVIESSLQGNFWTQTTAVPVQVDLYGEDADDVDDFTVVLQPPRCIRAFQAAGASSSSVTLPGMSASSFWHTVWEFDALATQATTGAEVRVMQGFRVLVSAAVRDAECV